MGIIFLITSFLGTTFQAGADEFRPFWDFRQWSAVRKPDNLYLSYMEKFKQHGITPSILINQNELPPFERVQRFLADASRRGIKVWIRTNRVTPKRGIPHRPHSTLDFALDESIQRETLEYLLSLARLSRQYPNLTGIVIGGEEWLGAKMLGRLGPPVLARFSPLAQKELGFALTGPLTEAQKIRYFDWVQQIQNNWYAKIWDTVKSQYPNLELLIFPSPVAVCGGRYSQFPTPAYWDIHDLIVTRNKPFSVLVDFYTVGNPWGSDQTAAMGAYLRAATGGKAPYYLNLQVQRTADSRPPTPRELEEDVMAALAEGAAGVGYWPIDMDSKKDIFETDPLRWRAVFEAIAAAARYRARQPRQDAKSSGLYVIKPRYSQFWEKDDDRSLSALAALRRAGLNPDFLLAEQVLSEPLPPKAGLFYLPETYKYEAPKVLEKLRASGKPIFFGLGPSEPFTPDKKPLPPLYEALQVKKAGPPFEEGAGVPQDVVATLGNSTYKLHLGLPSPPPRWNYPPELAVATFREAADRSSKDSPLAFSDGRLLFLAASDYGLLLAAADTNQNQQLLKALLSPYLAPVESRSLKPK
jgi:hypothetical protein